MNIRHSFTSETELKQTLDWIYEESKKGVKFNGIIEVAFNEVTIITAIHNIKSNKGANTAGIDGKIVDDYLQMDKDALINMIRSAAAHYKPKPVKRVYIEKANGKLRPLGLPNVLDKIIQECLRIVIEPIAEAKFYPNSYGFRKYRATEHAIADIIHSLKGNSKTKPIIAIEGDIESFFDNINHRLLIKKLYKMGIVDKRVLAIIKQMLKAGYVELGLYEITEKGTVQGGIISPLLANIYLNSFDWTVGRMYQQPKRRCKHITSDRQRLSKQGILKKYLVRYCDDWIILTVTIQEAKRLLKYLGKYFVHRLKLKLSKAKTLITDLTKKHAKFLGWVIKAGKPRKTPENPNPSNIVGKHYPNLQKVKVKVRGIVKEIKQLYYIKSLGKMAIEIERINSKIVGIANYHKTSICTNTFRYIDHKINAALYKAFKKRFGKKYKEHAIPLKELSNRPQRHKGYKTKTFAVKVDDMWIGVTKAFITHSQWIRHPFNQKITPYTEEGRGLYMQKRNKSLPMDRPPIYDIEELDDSNELNNFEYYMNREYAYNRDKGKCKVCDVNLKEGNRHCHRIEDNLALNLINKVKNLAWICTGCDEIIHKGYPLKSLPNKIISKIEKYRRKLKNSLCAPN